MNIRASQSVSRASNWLRMVSSTISLACPLYALLQPFNRWWSPTYQSIESKADDDVTKIRYEEGMTGRDDRQTGTGIQVNHLLSTMVVLIQPFSYHRLNNHGGRGGGGDDYMTTVCMHLSIYLLTLILQTKRIVVVIHPASMHSSPELQIILSTSTRVSLLHQKCPIIATNHLTN